MLHNVVRSSPDCARPLHPGCHAIFVFVVCVSLDLKALSGATRSEGLRRATRRQRRLPSRRVWLHGLLKTLLLKALLLLSVLQLVVLLLVAQNLLPAKAKLLVSVDLLLLLRRVALLLLLLLLLLLREALLHERHALLLHGLRHGRLHA